MGRGGGAALPTATRGDVSPMVAVNISTIALVAAVVASCSGNYGCAAGLLPRCHGEERRALLDMKEYSSVLGDWPGVAGGGDCCQWRGITCSNHTGRVIRIDLLLDISPNLASTLVQFKELEHLASLEWSTISGTLPNGLCNLRTLTVIDFSYNRIKGNIPSCLRSLHDLERLDLRHNKISGTIPEGLCNLRNLKELYLGLNMLGGPIPSCLGNLHNLERLHLGRNRISGVIPDGLCNLRHLKELDLYVNLLEGPIPQCLCSMRSLTQLGLAVNHLNGSIPSCLGNLHNLEVFHLEHNEFQGSIPPSIFPNLTRLTSVGIGGGRLEGTFSFSAFANLSNLEGIYIWPSKHGLEIEIVESPSWVPSFQLTYLLISGCSVVVNKGNGGGGGSRFPAGFISTQTRLQYLALEDNQMAGTLPLWVLCNISSSLSVLRLRRNNQLFGELPHALTRNQTTLAYLNVSCNQLAGEMLPKDTHNMPGLKFLLLHHNGFTGSIPPMVSNFSNLVALDVGHNHLECSLSHCLPSLPFSMIALSLRDNHLHGHLPTHRLCQMQHLHLLDLSGNNLTGKIPPCLTNISLWNHKGTDDNDNWVYTPSDRMGFTSKNLLLPYQGVPLIRMTGLDMSSNRLDGAIPWEIGELKGLRSLNLSNNALEGSLPGSMGNMKSLESLDLSHNHLSGSIPPHEMVQLNFLSTLCVAFNHLSGEIPSQGQFSTFSKSDFQGNPELCGAPLARNCSSDHAVDDDQKEADIEEGPSLWDNTILFYAWLVLSFAVGFWGVIATMVLNRRWRIRFFRVVDNFFGWASN